MPVSNLNNTVNAVYDPYEKAYWDDTSLSEELNRTFEICHGCRMCFKYCTAFPSLFEAIDQKTDGDVLKLSQTDKDQVIQECYQCKICYVKCPYTDQDNHSYLLNFPALMQRAVHIKTKEKGVPFRDKILQNADLAGKMSSGIISAFVNFVFNSNFHRKILQVLMGIHKDKHMPRFYRKPFAKWYKKFRKKNKPLVSDQKVVLFSTCFVNYNNPEVARDVLFAFEKNGVEIIHPDQNCCGTPGINSGDLKWATKKMKKNINKLLPYVQKGYKILPINPTCSLTLKKEYTTFLPAHYKQQADIISNNTYDLHEYLFELKKEDKFNRDFKSSPGDIAYHIPCHLKAQNIGYRSRDIMKLIPNTKITLIDECSGHNGNWAMKKENFKLSLKAGEKAFESFNTINSDNSKATCTDCPLAAIQLNQGINNLKNTKNKRVNIPMHPIQIVAKAYKTPQEGGFQQSA